MRSAGVPARVVEIILDESHPLFRGYEDIGSIRYRVIGRGGDESNPEYPLSRNNFSYPLKNEIVYLFSGPAPLDKASVSYTFRTYYTTPIAVWNSPHFNVHPEGGRTNYDAGPGFVELSNIAPLLPHLGDIILEGRYGQSIRFTGVKSKNNPLTSDFNSGTPLTIIRNGQRPDILNGYIPVVEDINKDISSIYLTSAHHLDFELANNRRVSHLRNPPEDPKTYARPQIAVNSDRVVLNARWDDLLLSASNRVAVSSNATHIDSNDRIVLDADKIFLGEKAYKFRNVPEPTGVTEPLQQPAVRGAKNEEILDGLSEILALLISTMTSPEPPELYVPKLVAMATMLQEKINNLRAKIPETKSKKVFVE